MQQTTLATLLSLASLSAAHFTLSYPTVRGFNEDKLTQFPCGSFNTPSTSRTEWPLSGGSIALDLGHSQTNVEVLLGVGSDVGTAFNTVLRSTFSVTGLGNFCMTGFSLPAGLNLTAGTNATIQVVTNGDPEGGLYNCADITFVESVQTRPDACKNATQLTVGAAVAGHANGSTSTGSQTPASTTSRSSSTPSPTGNSAMALGAGLGGLVMAGAAALAIVL